MAKVWRVSTLDRGCEYGPEQKRLRDGLFVSAERAVAWQPKDWDERAVDDDGSVTLYYGVRETFVERLRERGGFWWYGLPEQARIIYIDPVYVRE